MSGRPWTRAEEAALRELFAERASAREAAEELGRSRAAVLFHARLRGIKPGLPPHSSEPDYRLRALVLGMIAMGLRLTQIARLRGVPRGTVSEMVRRMARDGLVVATGRGSARRYRVTRKWTYGATADRA